MGVEYMENREINLNREQKAAVTHTEGPLLVIGRTWFWKDKDIGGKSSPICLQKKKFLQKT